jgi:hypothetical protein
MLLRSRALLWFSLIGDFANGMPTIAGGELDRLDDRIRSDLAKYLDGPVRRQIAQARRELEFWMAAYRVVSRGSFSRLDQATLSEMFDPEMVEKLKAFLEGTSRTEADSLVHEKVRFARQELERLIPRGFQNEISAIERSFSGRFS